MFAEHMEAILQYANILIWIEYTLAISTLLVFRYKFPYVDRSYKVWISTAIFMIFVSVALVIAEFVREPIGTSIVVLFMLSGIPIYYVCLHKKWMSCLKLDLLCRIIIRNSNLVECKMNT